MKHQTEELNNEQAREVTGGTSIRNTSQQSPYGDMGAMQGQEDGTMHPKDMPVHPHSYGSDEAGDTKYPVA